MSSLASEQRASTLAALEDVFDPATAVEPTSAFYVPRQELELDRLKSRLLRARNAVHFFLCGHRGSGKTTELKRLLHDEDLCRRYLPLYVTVQQFGGDPVTLTHDALLLEVGFALSDAAARCGVQAAAFRKELEAWSIETVKTFTKGQAAVVEANAGASAWLAAFRAGLVSRREWQAEQKQILEPRVQDLIGIVNRLAVALKEKAGREALVFVDDLEKGESEAHREMHQHLFKEQYAALVQPHVTLVYTLPISARRPK